MSIRFLTVAEQARANSCPNDISQSDLDAYFQLTTNDLIVLTPLRGDHNRLGFALQLCCLRYLGFFPDNLVSLTLPIISYVAKQLNLPYKRLEAYGQREKTLNAHQQQVMQHLGYRRATPIDLLSLEQWLLERALEHDKPKLLFEMACDYLRRSKIVRMGVTRLARMIGTARQQAERITFDRLQPFLTQERRDLLGNLLSAESSGWTPLTWFQQTPTSNQTSAILQTLDKLAFLQTHDVGSWDLSMVNPNRLKWLAKKGSRVSPQGLRELKDQARYPVLSAFLQEALYTFTDGLVEMVDQRLWELHGECRLAFRNDRLAATKMISETLRTLQALGQVFLDESVDDHAVRQEAFKKLSEAQLNTALTRATQLIRPDNDAFVDYFAKRHRAVQNFSKQLLNVMAFRASSQDQGLLEGLKLVSEIHSGQRRKLPSNAPTAFVPNEWQPEVIEEDGFNWRSYEIAALWVLRQKLRSGDVYVPHSRRFTELESYFIPKREWAGQRGDVLSLIGTPLSAEVRLSERFETLETLAAQVDTLIAAKHSDLREEKGRLIVTPSEQDTSSPELIKLRQLIDVRLPRCDITDVLIEVDNWTGFSDAFVHLDDVQGRDRELLTQLYACLLAQACNLGFKQMATSAGLPYRRLLWCNRWYLRDDTLNDAVTTLVNYHHSLPLSEVWGAGLLSSSDGQRFPVSGDTRRARALPRYFGYGKGVTAYSWSTDQFSQYGSKVIPSTVRDATYVLDAILDNETDLDIVEHTTDTAGFTELIFALFGLLGLTFSPRIRDLADQKLYRSPNLELATLPELGKHFSSTLNIERNTHHWDDMLRVALSLKKGYCTSSLLVQKLQAYPRQHPIMRGLQEYGRLDKTIHILRWYADLGTRKRVSKQLNKGEALHRLRSHLMLGKHGEIEGLEDEPLDQQFTCLNLVTNAIILFNTVHMTRIVDDLRREGLDIQDDDLARAWPTRFQHINLLGRYHFDTKRMRPEEEL